MKPEALDAFATQSTRPTALDAASTDEQKDTTQHSTEAQMSDPDDAHNRIPTPLGEHTDGTSAAAAAVSSATSSAVHVVDNVVEGVKSALHEAVAWTEKKADELAKSEETGPYGSLATCAGGVSDLDGIAMGVLPATTQVQENGGERGVEQEERKDGGRGSRL